LAFNALTGGEHGAFGHFELDYWGESYGEATRQLVDFVRQEREAGRPMPAKPMLFVCGSNLSAGYYLPQSILITDERAAADFFLGGDLTNPRCVDPPNAGPPIIEVKREDVLLSYVLDLRALHGKAR